MASVFVWCCWLVRTNPNCPKSVWAAEPNPDSKLMLPGKHQTLTYTRELMGQTNKVHGVVIDRFNDPSAGSPRVLQQLCTSIAGNDDA